MLNEIFLSEFLLKEKPQIRNNEIYFKEHFIILCKCNINISYNIIISIFFTTTYIAHTYI